MKWRLEQPRWSTGVLVRAAGTYMRGSTGKRCTNAAWCASNQRGVASCRAGWHEASVHSSGPWLQAATPPEKSLFFPSVFPRALSLSSSSLRSTLKRARKTLHRSVSVVCCSLIRRSLKMFAITSDRICCSHVRLDLELLLRKSGKVSFWTSNNKICEYKEEKRGIVPSLRPSFRRETKPRTVRSFAKTSESELATRSTKLTVYHFVSSTFCHRRDALSGKKIACLAQFQREKASGTRKRFEVKKVLEHRVFTKR